MFMALGRRARGVTRRITATGVAWNDPPPPAAPPRLGEPGKIAANCASVRPILSCNRYDLREIPMTDRVRPRTIRTPVPPLDTMAAEVTRMDSGGTTITWFGHACVEVRTPGDKVVLFDPWFANPRSPCPPEQVERCDVMLVTPRPRRPHRERAADRQPDPPGLARDPRAAALVEQHLLGAGRRHRHEQGRDRGGARARGHDDLGRSLGGRLGHRHRPRPGTSASRRASSSSSRTAARIYHAGDTNVFGDMRLIGELYRPDVAFLPIGGHFTMGPREAALAVELLGVREVLPIHYGTFPILAGTPDELRSELAARGLGDVGSMRRSPADRSLADTGLTSCELRARLPERPGRRGTYG